MKKLPQWIFMSRDFLLPVQARSLRMQPTVDAVANPQGTWRTDLSWHCEQIRWSLAADFERRRQAIHLYLMRTNGFEAQRESAKDRSDTTLPKQSNPSP
jgi:hypothetical protein